MLPHTITCLMKSSGFQIQTKRFHPKKKDCERLKFQTNFGENVEVYSRICHAFESAAQSKMTLSWWFTSGSLSLENIFAEILWLAASLWIQQTLLLRTALMRFVNIVRSIVEKTVRSAVQRARISANQHLWFRADDVSRIQSPWIITLIYLVAITSFYCFFWVLGEKRKRRSRSLDDVNKSRRNVCAPFFRLFQRKEHRLGKEAAYRYDRLT